MAGSSSLRDFQPPLRWYAHTWRIALCLLLSVLAWNSSAAGQWNHHPALFWLDLSIGLAAYGMVFWRRRWPFAIALTLAVACSVSAVAAGPASLALMSFATRRRLSRLVLVGVLAVLAAQAYVDTQPISKNSSNGIHISTDQGGGSTARTSSSVYADLAANVFGTAALIATGMFVGSRRELLWTLRERAREAEEERDRRIASARTSERTAIAREMHDVLAHRISRVSMQAGAMAFRDDLDADQLRQQAGVIQLQANAALNELRDVLGVLRSSADRDAAEAPQPTHSDVAALIAEARESGMHVEYLDSTEPGMADAAGRTVYRIVQEGLTNARKHAPGALLHVEVTGSEPAGISVVIQNPLGFSEAPSAPGSGLGLVGLAERAALRGGRLEHGREGAMFVLRGWIPWGS